MSEVRTFMDRQIAAAQSEGKRDVAAALTELKNLGWDDAPPLSRVPCAGCNDVHVRQNMGQCQICQKVVCGGCGRRTFTCNRFLCRPCDIENNRKR